MNLTLFNKTQTPSLLNELFDNSFWNLPEIKPLSSSLLPPANILDSENETKIEMVLPGLIKENIKISIDNNVLNVSYQNQSKNEESNEKYLRKEYSNFSFSRSFKLDSRIEIEKINSKMENGILYINLPKKENVSVKLIEIQ